MLPNIHRPFFLEVEDPGWLVIDFAKLPHDPHICLLIERLQKDFQIVLFVRQSKDFNWSVRGVVDHWENYVGPFEDVHLMMGQTHMLSAGMLTAVQNQPDWDSLLGELHKEGIEGI